MIGRHQDDAPIGVERPADHRHAAQHTPGAETGLGFPLGHEATFTASVLKFAADLIGLAAQAGRTHPEACETWARQARERSGSGAGSALKPEVLISQADGSSDDAT